MTLPWKALARELRRRMAAERTRAWQDGFDQGYASLGMSLCPRCYGGVWLLRRKAMAEVKPRADLQMFEGPGWAGVREAARERDKGEK